MCTPGVSITNASEGTPVWSKIIKLQHVIEHHWKWGSIMKASEGMPVQIKILFLSPAVSASMTRVAGCEQHEYVDCIKPSHHALPAIKHKNRKISRWEANYLQVKNWLSKYFEGELQALLKRSVTRERSHTWYQCTALQCFQFSDIEHFLMSRNRAVVV